MEIEETAVPYDAVVVGGGPAGAATALALAGSGARVALVERSRYEAVRIGETFAPGIQTVLAGLGVWESFAASERLPSYGVRSFWGSPAGSEQSFLFNPFGTGWHVDRRSFDAALCAVAESRGVRVLRGVRLTACERLRPSGWSLGLNVSPGGSLSVRAGFVVDATGRAASLARRLGAVRQAVDAQIAIAGHFKSPTAGEPDRFTLIEAVADGWWYTAPLPGQGVVAAFLTDPDLAPALGGRTPEAWSRWLAASPRTAGRLRGHDLRGPLRTLAASSARILPATGDGWLAVGDAAFAFDPLSGDGVDRALRAGRSAATALAAGDRTAALTTYGDEQEELFAAYCRQRTAFYSREKRWRFHCFWARRSSLV
jgi:flavin-dependent dehydrogenase